MSARIDLSHARDDSVTEVYVEVLAMPMQEEVNDVAVVE